jgi:hypothetical protein
LLNHKEDLAITGSTLDNSPLIALFMNTNPEPEETP